MCPYVATFHSVLGCGFGLDLFGHHSNTNLVEDSYRSLGYVVEEI